MEKGGALDTSVVWHDSSTSTDTSSAEPNKEHLHHDCAMRTKAMYYYRIFSISHNLLRFIVKLVVEEVAEVDENHPDDSCHVEEKKS